MKRVLFACLALLGIVASVTSASATTLVSGHLSHSGGEWIQYNKGYLYNDLKNTTGVDKISIDSLSPVSKALVIAFKGIEIHFSV